MAVKERHNVTKLADLPGAGVSDSVDCSAADMVIFYCVGAATVSIQLSPNDSDWYDVALSEQIFAGGGNALALGIAGKYARISSDAALTGVWADALRNID